MEKRRNNIIVTGAAGLIGSAVLETLQKAGNCTLTAVYHRSSPHISIKGITPVRLDLSRRSSWLALGNLNVDALIHCAAVVPSSFAGPAAVKAGKINLMMDTLALWYATQKKAKLIYLSSSSVYGFTTGRICRENSMLKPQGEYAREKVMAEKMIYAQRKNLDYFIFRVSSPYGPEQHTNNVLKIFVTNGLTGQPLVYYGNGSRTQDFTYVEDVAGACLKALSAEYSGIYNIASAQPISMKELAFLVQKLTGKRSAVVASGIADPQEDYRARFDITKARKFLRWQPVSPPAKGIKKFISQLKEENK